MEILPCRGSLDISCPDNPIAEHLAVVPLLGIPFNDWLELRQDLGLLHALLIQLIQPLAFMPSAKVQIVRSGCLPDERDLRQIRPGAPVRAPGHADGDSVVAQSGLLDGALELGDEGGKTASGERDACHSIKTQPGEVEIVHLVLSKVGLCALEVLFRYVSNDEMLVRGEAEVAPMPSSELAQTSLDGEIWPVLDLSVLDEHAKVPAVVNALGPSVTVRIISEVERAGLLEFVSQMRLNLGLEPFDTAVVDSVLKACMLAVGAVSEIALDEHDLLGDIDGLVRCAEPDDVCCARVGFGVVVGHTHATTDSDVISDELVAFGNGDVTEIVGVHIHVVVGWDGDDDLELARQVGEAVQGFKVLHGVTRHLLIVQPDLVVGGGARGEVVHKADAEVVDDLVDLGKVRVGIQHDVAGLVDPADGCLQIPLEHAVELEGLACGQLERGAGVLVNEFVHSEPLLRRGNTARAADADHETERLFNSHFASFLAQVAVVLHVRPVVLENLSIGLLHAAGGFVQELLCDGTAQEIGHELVILIAELGGLGLCHHVSDTERQPQLGGPGLQASFESVCVLVVTKAELGQLSCGEGVELSVDELCGLVVVVGILGPGPIAKHSESSVGQVQVGSRERVQCAPELARVGRELALSRRAAHDHHVSLARQILHIRVIVQRHQLRLETASLRTRGELLRDALGVPVIGPEQHSERRTGGLAGQPRE
ncbi:hypothetical protein BC936DRAFT_147803 [Jimgerdemannia flammicorona]|uniref:Uncharacterized protein n=1 Tax=Jimgerdemannia flammicorona TaxID=994334 RepID=A0A433D4H8_9FUNG|nr:hypothetical protein BC936DRAFT_147803 [Jimgerdemannia flammicorona]